MIGILLEDAEDFLQLDPGTVITITLNNPLFGDASVLSPGSSSLPFTILAGDKNEHNAKLLGNPDVLENIQSKRVSDVSVYFDRVLFKKGTLRVDSGDGGRLSTYFTSGLNSMNPALKTAKLTDVMDEEFLVADNLTKFIYIKWTPPDLVASNIIINGQIYTFPSDFGTDLNTAWAANTVDNQMIYAPYAWTTVTFPGVLNPPDSRFTGGYFIIAMARKLPGNVPFPANNFDVPITVTVPQDQFNHWVIGADLDPYYDEFDDFLNPFLTGAYPHNKFRFPFMFNFGVYPNVAPDYINLRDVNGIVRNKAVLTYTLTPQHFNNIQPFVLLKYVLDKIATEFDFSWEGDFFNDPEVATILIDNSATLNDPQVFIGEGQFLFWKKSFNLRDHVPDMTVIDFLKGLQSRFNLGIYPNEQTRQVKIMYRENVAKANAYKDITSSSSSIKKFEDLRVSGFKIISEKDASDKIAVDESLTIGDPEVTVPITCSRITSTRTLIYFGAMLNGPQVSREDRASFKLRIFHYKGLVNNGVFSYPAADVNGVTMKHDLTEAEPSLYSLYWKYWLLFQRDRRSINIETELSLDDLLNTNWEQKKRFDRNDYLVKSMEVQLTNSDIKVTQLQLYTMKIDDV